MLTTEDLYFYGMVKRLMLLFAILAGLSACKPGKELLRTESQYIRVENLPVDSILVQMQQFYGHRVDSLMNEVLGYTKQAMPKERNQPETLLGNFVADLVLEHAREIDPQVDFCLLNIGGLRNSLPEGAVTRGDIFQLMPFDNEVVMVDLDGRAMQELLEYLCDQPVMPVSGLRLQVPGREMQIGGLAWDPEKSYRVVTSDFLAGGGDKMNFLTHSAPILTGKRLRDIIIEHFQKAAKEGKVLDAQLDGRIQIK